MTESQILLFLVASLAIIITPGQDMILVISRSIAQGARAGIATAAGVSTGLLGHTILAAFGLGALLSRSELAFGVIKIAGAAYLVYLGVKLMFSSGPDLGGLSRQVVPMRKLFWQGALSNLSNPKITIFYFAFLPQFVPSGTVHIGMVLLTLGSVFAFLTFMIKAPIGYGAGNLSSWLRSRPYIQRCLNRFSGLVLIGLGVRLALQKRT